MEEIIVGGGMLLLVGDSLETSNLGAIANKGVGCIGDAFSNRDSPCPCNPRKRYQ